ncbi:MAG: NAD(P)/FAD-dependent oxidoreductase [Planctomycetes bacterium]|nr:NAD(P)/FAD-dependent oxidoreductase [Planctomycetota bacterium]
MERCDVLIVGAGPAGSCCAWALRESGLKVLLVDKATFPRDKVCAGWITPPLIDTLQIDLDEYRGGRILQPFTGFRVGMIDGPDVVVRYDRVVSYGIRRCQFDDYLRRRSGSECRLGEPVRRIERMPNEWIVNGTLSARVLVGAGGHFCPVARFFGSGSSQLPVVRAQEIEFSIPADSADAVASEPEVPEIFFCQDLEGYGWCVRKGEFLNIGLGRLDPARLREHVQDFVRFLRERRGLRITLPDRWHGHAYRIYERAAPKLIGDRALLIGDAAGLAYPRSGEGIRPAIESGLLAAKTILEADGDYSLGKLQAYAKAIAQRFGEPPAGYWTEWLPTSLRRAVGRWLVGKSWFARGVVMNRWFLHTDQRALAPPSSLHSHSASIPR